MRNPKPASIAIPNTDPTTAPPVAVRFNLLFFATYLFCGSKSGKFFKVSLLTLSQLKHPKTSSEVEPCASQIPVVGFDQFDSIEK